MADTGRKLSRQMNGEGAAISFGHEGLWGDGGEGREGGELAILVLWCWRLLG